MKPAFWWVVKTAHGYLDTTDDANYWPEQGLATPFLFRSSAKHARDEYAPSSGRVVLVHARIPEPKLPDWMCRSPLKPRQFAVFSVSKARVWEYLFMVAPSGSFFCVDSVSHGAGGAEHCGPPASWKPEVMAEAAARAAKWLRDERRGKA